MIKLPGIARMRPIAPIVVLINPSVESPFGDEDGVTPLEFVAVGVVFTVGYLEEISIKEVVVGRDWGGSVIRRPAEVAI
jgi:hypothetical protein